MGRVCAGQARHTLLLIVAVMLSLASSAQMSTVSQITEPVDPWPALVASIRTARPSALYKFVDYEVPRNESIRTKCLAERFCECTISDGYNRTFWLNTASAVYNGQLYVAILQRTVSLRTVVHYRQINKTMRGQIFEANQLLFCKAQLRDQLELRREDCQLVEPGPGYKEKHPYPPRGYHFELNGLIDPRLITAGDGLFLQAGCRPRHLSDNPNITTKFREGLCMVKLLGGAPAATSQQQLPAAAGTARRQLRQTESVGQAIPAVVPSVLLPGMTISSTDWPVGKLMSITHSSGVGSWEKSWSPFTYKGTVLWSRSLMPHQVVTVHANGVATTLYKVENHAVFDTVRTVCGTGPRGNTAAALLMPEDSGLPRAVYLNILHYTPHRRKSPVPTERNCHEYTNFFYLMDSEPPFNILEVARPPIPLIAATNPILDSPPLNFGMGYISFPTGMVIINKQVVITYGSGDSQSRIFTAALSDVLNTFSHTWITKPPNSTLVEGHL